MKAVEFEGRVTEGGQIEIPPDLAADIPVGDQVRVVVMWEPSDADVAWRLAGRERFEAAYCPEDAVYEQLMNDAELR